MAKLSDKDKLEQPRNPDGSRNDRFFKLYGENIKRNREIKSRQTEGARAEWQIVNENKLKKLDSRPSHFTFNMSQERWNEIFGKKWK